MAQGKKREDIEPGGKPTRAVAYFNPPLYVRLKKFLKDRGVSFTDWSQSKAKQDLGE